MTPTMVIRCFSVVFKKCLTTVVIVVSLYSLCRLAYLLLYENDSTFSTTKNEKPSRGQRTAEMNRRLTSMRSRN